MSDVNKKEYMKKYMINYRAKKKAEIQKASIVMRSIEENDKFKNLDDKLDSELSHNEELKNMIRAIRLDVDEKLKLILNKIDEKFDL